MGDLEVGEGEGMGANGVGRKSCQVGTSAEVHGSQLFVVVPQHVLLLVGVGNSR